MDSTSIFAVELPHWSGIGQPGRPYRLGTTIGELAPTKATPLDPSAGVAAKERRHSSSCQAHGCDATLGWRGTLPSYLGRYLTYYLTF